MKKRLAAVLLFLSMLLSLSGCLGNKPENIVDKFCAAMIAFDPETASQYTVDGSSSIDIPFSETTANGTSMSSIVDYIKGNAAKITYEIGDVAVNGDIATVPVHFTYVDASPIMIATATDYISQAFLLALSGADDSALETLIVTIFNEKVDTVDAAEGIVDITFTCEKIDSEWKKSTLSEDDQNNLTAILTCNITNAAESIF